MDIDFRLVYTYPFIDGITNAQRNIILQHHNSFVFQKNYAFRYMSDIQIIYRDLNLQIALMRAANRMSRTIDSRRLRKLSFAQQIEIDRYSKIRFLRRRLKSLLQILQDQKRSIVSIKGTLLYDYYRQVYQVYRNLKRRHKKALLIEIKEKYKKKQPIIDIQQQLKKLPVAKQKTLKTKIYVFVKRIQVIDALFTFVTSTIAKKC